jgi:hypothetical protein
VADLPLRGEVRLRNEREKEAEMEEASTEQPRAKRLLFSQREKARLALKEAEASYPSVCKEWLEAGRGGVPDIHGHLANAALRAVEEALIQSSVDDAKREAQAHRMAECNRIIGVLQNAGVSEDVIERVRSEA